MRFKKKTVELEGNSLIEGLEISGNFYEKNENRILTLLLKGIIVYLVTAGMLGGTITATGTDFSQVVFNLVVFVLSMIISLIYYNKRSENIGDIAYLFMIHFGAELDQNLSYYEFIEFLQILVDIDILHL